MQKEVRNRMSARFCVYSVSTTSHSKISLKRSSVNTGFVVKLNSAGALQRYESVIRESNIFSPGHWCDPGISSVKSSGKDAHCAEGHVSDSGVQGVLHRTLKRLGFKKHIHPPVFRHAYATHLLEANIPIRHVQKILGRKTLQSTMLYLHVTTRAQTDSHRRVSQVMQGVLSVIRDVLHIFIFYLIQPIKRENMMNVPDYSVEVIITALQICKYEERPLPRPLPLVGDTCGPLVEPSNLDKG
jgi:hypothetical protein